MKRFIAVAVIAVMLSALYSPTKAAAAAQCYDERGYGISSADFDVRALQQAVGAYVDGWFGPQTCAATINKLVQTGKINPTIDRSSVALIDRMIPWVNKRALSSRSSLPMAWDTSVVTPEPIPCATHLQSMTTGRVKPIAARERVPNLEINHVSVRL